VAPAPSNAATPSTFMATTSYAAGIASAASAPGG
jgi:hypothetical protein